MGGQRMSLDSCILVLRGWQEDEREVRAVLKGPVSFAINGLISATNELGFSLQVGAHSFVRLRLTGCSCSFLDADKGEIVVGRKVESGIVAVRPDFDLAIMLLDG